MQIKRFFTPGLAINTYLVFDEERRQGAIIDPTRQIDLYLQKAKHEKVVITHIIETHVHADFQSGSFELKKALEDKPLIHCSGMAGSDWIPKYADRIVYDLDFLQFGSIRLQALHTPGHTPEHLCWLLFDNERSSIFPKCLFTGDLLFVGSVGRQDLLGTSLEKNLAKQLYDSLFNKLNSLPEYLEIFPAHASGSLCGKGISKTDSSTLGYEKLCNRGLAPENFSAWEKSVLADISHAPAYFKRMKKINLQSLSSDHSLPPIIKKNQLKELKDCLYLDIRKAEVFSLEHIEGSLNIPFLPSFPSWVGSMIAENESFILIVDNLRESLNILDSLKLIGLEKNVKGIFEYPSLNQQEDDKIAVSSSPLLNVKTLKENSANYFVLDVRTPLEWKSHHISGARHIELTQLMQTFEELPKDKPIAVVCQSGNRASIAASFLNQRGFLAVNVKGGMQAWSALETQVAP